MEKKIGKSGAVTIPSSLRRDLGIQGKEKVDISYNDAGDLIVRRIAGTCIFCGAHEGIRPYKGRFVCKDCGVELGGVFGGK